MDDIKAAFRGTAIDAIAPDFLAAWDVNLTMADINLQSPAVMPLLPSVTINLASVGIRLLSISRVNTP
ncbi:hypothetical protein SCLCIDRAFT_1224857 [Scleroderma citrinum Foug A]|uniref:Uncharacterized protein n=1 Tax=Scleroderma citrinum Foug A TaxID=1036808 RepID=A0A0C2YN12_9AGAM|nr:hypothetical protein SCLCIDRAFT_1224857 [Scleroderma citrinum Foug A]